MMTHKSLASAARKPIVAVCFVVSMIMGTSVTKADGPAPRHRTSHFEVRFMMNMIDHHTMAIMMAELCEDRAIHEELLQLCDQIIAAQSAEVQEMQLWLHDWYGIHHRPRMNGRMRKDLRELAKLDGEEFEMEFLMMMVEHHSEAIDEGEECLDRAFHEDLLELCHNIVESQTMEIHLMEGWLCSWYDLCDE